MRSLIPHPLLSTLLTLVWLILTRFSLGNLVLGILVALVAGWAMAALEPDRPKLRRLHLVPGLALRIFWDVLRSNITVTRQVLFRSPRRPGFIEIPLELRDRNALAILAIVITATPGTAWIDLDRVRNVLTLHAFDLDGDADLIDFIKNRYEKPLLEIFA